MNEFFLIYKMTLYTLLNEKGNTSGLNFDPLDSSVVLDELCSMEAGGKIVPLAFDTEEGAQTFADKLKINSAAHFIPRKVSYDCEQRYRWDLISGIETPEEAVSRVQSESETNKLVNRLALATIVFSVFTLKYVGIFDKIVEYFTK